MTIIWYFLVMLMQNEGKGMKNFCRNFVANILYNSRIVSLMRNRMSNENALVLMYHGVARDDDKIADGDWLQVKESEFRVQMEYLVKHYNVVSLNNAHSYINSDMPNVIVTFDDGYRNNYSIAYPILRDLGIPATIFVVTGMIDTSNIFWYDRLRVALKDTSFSKIEKRNIFSYFKKLHPSNIEENLDFFMRKHELCISHKMDTIKDVYSLLELSQMKEMENNGLISFGSHTHGHEIVTRLSDKEAYSSILYSVKLLKSMTSNMSEYFCFPNGSFQEEHVNIIKDLGFKGALTVNRGIYRLHDDPYKIPRLPVGRHHSLPYFATSLSTFFSY